MDDSDYSSAEKQLNISYIRNENNSQFHSNADIEADEYYKTCVEELSRSYPVISIGTTSHHKIHVSQEKNLKPILHFPEVEELTEVETTPNLHNMDPSINTKPRILRNYFYYPEGTTFPSLFRRQPPTSKVFLEDDCRNILLKIGPTNKISYSSNKYSFMEPLFGSVALYGLLRNRTNGEYDLCRLSENFHFDATPPALRRGYGDSVYFINDDKSIKYNESNNVINPTTNMSLCTMSYSSSWSVDDLYLVILTNKVLTSEPDKALQPYINPSKGGISNILGSNDNESKVREAISRLGKYRQPVGFGIVKLFNADGSMNSPNNNNLLNVPLYSMKYCLSDMSIKQVILLISIHI
jgi:hypothetical protein